MEQLHPHLQTRLRESFGIDELFPFQRKVVSDVLSNVRTCTLSDICLCSPTGSGKTMAYALPIVQTLMQTITRQVRCVVVLPTRDLAVQVGNVFAQLLEGINLKVVVLAGELSFQEEQQQLFRSWSDMDGHISMTPNVDIVVAIPGRLVEHLRRTPGFTLQHLKFLVVDEADVLLAADFKDWAMVVVQALPSDYTKPVYQQPPLGARILGLSPAATPVPGFAKHPVHKMLCSATLTQTLMRLTEMQLVRPRFLTFTGISEEKCAEAEATMKRYILPSTLQEHYMIVDLALKPLYVLCLLRTLFEQLPASGTILVFCNSVDSVHRLARFVELAGVPQAREYSRLLPIEVRSEIVAALRTGRLRVGVCSDVMARGMDLNFDAVINYDAPMFTETYVHRVGRTARAGRSGRAFTLLVAADLDAFLRMRDHAHSDNAIQEYSIENDVLAKLEPRYQELLTSLEEVLTKEKQMEMDSTAPLFAEGVTPACAAAFGFTPSVQTDQAGCKSKKRGRSDGRLFSHSKKIRVASMPDKFESRPSHFSRFFQHLHQKFQPEDEENEDEEEEDNADDFDDEFGAGFRKANDQEEGNEGDDENEESDVVALLERLRNKLGELDDDDDEDNEGFDEAERDDGEENAEGSRHGDKLQQEGDDVDEMEDDNDGYADASPFADPPPTRQQGNQGRGCSWGRGGSERMRGNGAWRGGSLGRAGRRDGGAGRWDNSGGRRGGGGFGAGRTVQFPPDTKPAAAVRAPPLSPAPSAVPPPPPAAAQPQQQAPKVWTWRKQSTPASST